MRTGRDSTNASRKKILVVTYDFPPVGETGARRISKIVKYLPRLGYDCIVVTASRVLRNERDFRACVDIPDSTVILRTPSLEPVSAGPGHPRLLQLLRRGLNVPSIPSVVGLWGACAWLPMLRACQQYQPDAIFSTGPDFTAHVLGRIAAIVSRKPLIVDYRDEWTSHPTREARSAGARRLLQTKYRADAHLERWVLSGVSRVTTVTEGMAVRLIQSFPDVTDRIVVIPNGFDPEEMMALGSQRHASASQSEKVIVHLGSVFREAQRAPSFFEDLQSVAEQHAQPICVRQVGRIAAEFQALWKSYETPRLRFEFVAQLSAVDALSLASTADLLLLFRRGPGEDRYLNLKLFEYLSLSAPILALCHRDGETSRMLDRCGGGWAVDIDRQERASDVLSSWLRGICPPRRIPSAIQKLSWEQLAQDLARVLEREILEGEQPDHG